MDLSEPVLVITPHFRFQGPADLAGRQYTISGVSNPKVSKHVSGASP